jgi:hypothetical protein
MPKPGGKARPSFSPVVLDAGPKLFTPHSCSVATTFSRGEHSQLDEGRGHSALIAIHMDFLFSKEYTKRWSEAE